MFIKGKRYRALNPWSAEDGALLEAISRGEFTLNGFRNRDLRKLLYPNTDQITERRRRSAALTRKLAILRAHRLIRKVPATHRYILTQTGRRIITALLAARRADVDQLLKWRLDCRHYISSRKCNILHHSSAKETKGWVC